MSDTYEHIFDEQGVAQEFRGPEHYFFHTVTEAESLDHAGETYAIPTQIYMRNDMPGLYDLQENGAIINTRAHISPDADVAIDGRAIVGESTLEGDVHIGWAAVVRTGVRLTDTNVGEEAEIGPHSDIAGADIGARTVLGGAVAMGVAREGRTVVEAEAVVDSNVLLAGNNRVGAYTVVESGAHFEDGASVGRNARVEELAKLRMNAKVGDEARVMPHVTVKAGKKIRPGTIVVPRQYRRAKRGW